MKAEKEREGENLMIVESVAILGITVCILAVFVRSGNADYALATLPLLVVPAANLLGWPIAKLVNHMMAGNQVALVRGFVGLAGVAVACVLIVLLSGKIKVKKNKRLYIWMCSFYCVVLGCVFLYNVFNRG